MQTCSISIWAAAWDFQQCGMCHQQRLRSACAYAQSDQSIWSLEDSMSVRLLTEQYLELLSFKGGCRGSLSLHLSKCHIVGNHVPRLKCKFVKAMTRSHYPMVSPFHTMQTCSISISCHRCGLSLYQSHGYPKVMSRTGSFCKTSASSSACPQKRMMISISKSLPKVCLSFPVVDHGYSLLRADGFRAYLHLACLVLFWKQTSLVLRTRQHQDENI